MKTLLLTAAAAALFAPGIAAAADLTGTWKVDLDIAGMMFHAACDMKEDAMMALTGTCTGTDANPMPVAMTGMVDGNNVKWAYDITYQGNPMHVAYTGAVKSDKAMDGAVDVQIAQGTFTATKQ
jgi:hypothetical protein